MAKIATSALTGKALLQKIKNSDLPRRELAKQCGYYTVSNDGESRISLAEFYDAVLVAKGIALEPEASKDGRGREASYRTSVHKNGSIVIGDSYTKEMGLKPGDEFEIRLGYKHIRLIQLDGDKAEVTDGDQE